MPIPGQTVHPPALSATTAAVVVHQLSFRYDGAQVAALDDITLKVPMGSIVALLGPNGAGKSTLVKVLLGLNRPSAGTVEVFGGTPRAALRQGEVGTMLQSSGIADFVTVTQLIDFVGGRYRNPLPTSEVLATAGLKDLARRRVEKLSGGEQQRVRFALTLVGQPRLLILDEPTNEMDVASRQDFWATVRAAAVERGRTVLFTTHQMAEVDTAADRVVVIGKGKKLADETPNALRLRGGAPTVQFRWKGTPPTNFLRHLTGVTSFQPGRDVQMLQTTGTDLTLGELVRFVPEAIDLKVVDATLDSAYLSVIGELDAIAS
jgi:ABC-2 type transport system ATP-binding protein